jgi:hypothetical protein
MTCMPLFLSRHELWPNLNAYVVMSLSPPRVGSASGRCWLPPVPGDRFRGQVTLDQVTLNGVKNHPWIRPALPSLSSISKAGASHFQLNLETFQVWKEMLFVYCRMCFFLQAWVSGRAAARQYKWLRPAGATKSLSKWHLLNIEYPIEWYVYIYIYGVFMGQFILLYIYIISIYMLYQYIWGIHVV